MAEDDLSTCTPYELGETDDARAVPYLIRYLYRGGPNERHLAALALGKLARQHRDACAVSAVALLDCLDDPAPQVRQYALNALALLPLPPEAITLLAAVRDGDEKPYNREVAADILRRLGSTPATGGQPPSRTAAEEAEQLAGAEEASPSVATPAPPATAPTAITLDILNRFLEAAYAEPRRLSELLRAAGLADDAITTLRREHLSAYLSLLTQRLRDWLMQALEERTADVFIRRFELDGCPTPTFAELGRQYGVSRERVRQLEVKVIKRLRSRHYRAALERLTADAARETLGLPPVEGTPSPESAGVEGAPRQPRSSALITLARFEAGLTPAEIAAERELAEGTIYAHLAACIRAGSAAAARAVTPEMVQAVHDVMQGDDPPVSFAELRHRMPSSFSYGHLLCVVAAHPELLPEGRELTEDEVRQARIAIRATVADLAGKLPRSSVIKLLVGSSSSRVAELRGHTAYGALAGLDTTALWQIIDDLVKTGELGFDEHSRLIYIGAPDRQPVAE